MTAAAAATATAIAVRSHHAGAARIADPEIACRGSAGAARSIASIGSGLTVAAGGSRKPWITAVAAVAARGASGPRASIAAAVCPGRTTVAAHAAGARASRSAAISTGARAGRVASTGAARRTCLSRRARRPVCPGRTISRRARNERAVAQAHAAAVVAIHGVIRGAGRGRVERFDGQTVERRGARDAIAVDRGDASAADDARLNRDDIGRASGPIVLSRVTAVDGYAIHERHAGVVNACRDINLGFVLLNGFRQSSGKRIHRLLFGAGVRVAPRDGHENRRVCVAVDAVAIGIREGIVRKIRAHVLTFATILSVAVGIEIPGQTGSELTGAGGTTHVGVDHGRGAVVIAAAAIHGVGGGIRFAAVGRHVVAIGISRITRAEHARAAHAGIRGVRERAGRIACAAVVHVGIRVDFATVRCHHVAILVRTHARRDRA